MMSPVVQRCCFSQSLPSVCWMSNCQCRDPQRASVERMNDCFSFPFHAPLQTCHHSMSEKVCLKKFWGVIQVILSCNWGKAVAKKDCIAHQQPNNIKKCDVRNIFLQQFPLWGQVTFAKVAPLKCPPRQPCSSFHLHKVEIENILSLNNNLQKLR